MRNIIVILFLATTLLNLQSIQANVDSRRKALLNIIDKELNEVTRLNRQIGSRNPNLLLRLAELYLEKARLMREKENFQLLTLSPEKRRSINQRAYYRESNSYFTKAQKTCYYILKRFRNFKNRGDVFYILAFNAKEFQQKKKARKFFALAIKSSPRNSNTAIRSKLALGEMYYNSKNYEKAVPLYEGALKKRNQKWWTKDAYNLAWCYFRVGKKEKAIALMNEVNRLSENAQYVDMSDSVERDLAYFYSDTGKTKLAIQFYKKKGKDVSTNLLKVGKYLKGQGRFSSAQKMLNEALNHTENEKTKAVINLELLSLYERFGKTSKHLKTSKRLYLAHQKGLLDTEGVENLKFHVSKMSALLQKQVVSKAYRSQKGIRNAKAKYAIEYFNINAGLSGQKNYKSKFHAAETQYAIKKYNDAIKLYSIAYEGAKKSGDKKIATLSLNGILASLGGNGVSKNVNDKYLIKAYRLYLSKSPSDKKSFKIYQRLFSAYLEKGDIKNAEATLNSFRNQFPKAKVKQEAMLAKIIDYHKEKKDKAAIRRWVGRINSGEFQVSRKVADQLQLLLLTMQFENVEKYNTRGQKAKALRGYMKIHSSAGSSAQAKRNAAYNIAVLYHEASNKNKTAEWAVKSLDIMTSKEVRKFEGSFLLMASGLFGQRSFSDSIKVFEKSFLKLCKYKSKNKEAFFKNTVILKLAEGKVDSTYKTINLGYKCGIRSSVRREAKLDLMKELAAKKRWQLFEKLAADLEKDSKALPDLVHLNSLLANVYDSNGRKSKARSKRKKSLSLYQKSVSRKLPVPLEGLDVVASLKINNLKEKASQLKNVRLRFPEAKFNTALKKKFFILDRLINEALKIFKIGSGKGIVETYRILITSHEDLVKQISKFSPPGKSPEYIKSFKKSMGGIIQPISKKIKDYHIEAKRKISKNKILSPHNYLFLSNRPLPFAAEFLPRKKGVLMDRGGRR